MRLAAACACDKQQAAAARCSCSTTLCLDSAAVVVLPMCLEVMRLFGGAREPGCCAEGTRAAVSRKAAGIAASDAATAPRPFRAVDTLPSTQSSCMVRCCCRALVGPVPGLEMHSTTALPPSLAALRLLPGARAATEVDGGAGLHQARIEPLLYSSECLCALRAAGLQAWCCRWLPRGSWRRCAPPPVLRSQLQQPCPFPNLQLRALLLLWHRAERADRLGADLHAGAASVSATQGCCGRQLPAGCGGVSRVAYGGASAGRDATPSMRDCVPRAA